MSGMQDAGSGHRTLPRLRVASAIMRLAATLQVVPAVAALVTAVPVGLWLGDWQGAAILVGFGLVCLGLSALARRVCKRHFSESIGVNSAGVAAAWFMASMLVAIPIMGMARLDGGLSPSMMSLHDPVNAWYEGTSSLSSSGLTVVGKTTDVSESILLWRSVCQWVGGVGLAVFALLVIKPAEEGSSIYTAETRDWSADRGIRATVWKVLGAYAALTVACGVTFGLLGMNLWETVNHSLIMVSTGGLTVTDDSFTSYSSAIQFAAGGFMLLAAVSFGVLIGVASGPLRILWRRSDLRAFAVWLVALVMTFLWAAWFFGTQESKQSVFNLISAVSTCGVSSGTLADFAVPTVWLLIVAMFVGGCGDSTAGGFKVNRAVWALKMVVCQMRRDLGGRRSESLPTWNGQGLELEEVQQRSSRVLVVLFLFLASAALGYLVLRLAYDDSISSDRVLFQAVSSLSAVGLSMDLTGADRPLLARCTEIALMLLGRLEIMAVLLLPTVFLHPPKSEPEEGSSG